MTDLTNPKTINSELDTRQQTIITGGKKILGACQRNGDEAGCAGFGLGMFTEKWDYPPEFEYQNGFVV